MLRLRHLPLDHADAVRLNAELQQEYRVRYGGRDATPTDPREFDAPHGLFVVGYVDGAAVACGGWRARGGGEDPELRPGDAEIKRMYVVAAHRGHGYARAHEAADAADDDRQPLADDHGRVTRAPTSSARLARRARCRTPVRIDLVRCAARILAPYPRQQEGADRGYVAPSDGATRPPGE